MQRGIIRRRGNPHVLGCWQADVHGIVVQTEDQELRRAADAILRTPQVIPVHPPEHFEFAAPAKRVVELPSTIKYLALFALA